MRADPQITYRLREVAAQDYSDQLTRLLKSAADEIDALHEIERRQEWRPMILAPRDGTVILLAVDDAPSARHIVTVGSWDQTVGAWDCSLGMLGERDEGWIEGEHEWPVTHWKPLGDGPKHPTAEK